MPDAGRLARTADRHARREDAASRRFTRALLGVGSRALLQIQTALRLTGTVTAQQIRAALREAGYDQAVFGAVPASPLRLQTLEGQVRRWLAAREMVAQDLLGQGDVVARVIWRHVTLATLGRARPRRIIAQIADLLDLELRRAATLFDTQVSILGRTVEVAAADEAREGEEPDLFIYLGPIDDKTRDWCLQRVGRVYSRPEIDAMDNGQLPNPMLTGGGYNCRHRWVVLSEGSDLRALAGTTTRADDIQSDVDAQQTRRRR